jgi:hypothetical protein
MPCALIENLSLPDWAKFLFVVLFSANVNVANKAIKDNRKKRFILLNIIYLKFDVQSYSKKPPLQNIVYIKIVIF